MHHSGTSETLKDELRELMSRYGLNEKEIDDWLAHRGEEPEELRCEILTKFGGAS